MDGNSTLRKLPKMDVLVSKTQALNEQGISVFALVDNCRSVLEQVRCALRAGEMQTVPSVEEIAAKAYEQACQDSKFSLRPVINASGVVIHTNLGRAVLPQNVAEHVKRIACSYSTLEYDLTSGERGSRHAHIESLITKITGAEAAMAVNNNAAAIMLALSCVCAGREVVVSRGELVEIGGSFRVPDIMSLSGTHLREVGTTNKTKLADYKNAINDNTAALLKVHTSNFRIVGFSQSVDVATLSNLAKDSEIPLIYDLGSGLMTDEGAFSAIGETTVADAIASGADVVCFSGDKLFGGAQAGIIVGKKKYIDAMKAHQLARAVRIDKLSLAALEGMLRIYRDKQATQQIPVLRAIDTPLADLERRAKKLRALLAKLGDELCVVVKKSQGQVGGGSSPGENLASYVVEVTSKSLSANVIEAALRNYQMPIIARIYKGSVLLDVRTLDEGDFVTIQAALSALIAQRGRNHE